MAVLVIAAARALERGRASLAGAQVLRCSGASPLREQKLQPCNTMPVSSGPPSTGSQKERRRDPPVATDPKAARTRPSTPPAGMKDIPSATAEIDALVLHEDADDQVRRPGIHMSAPGPRLSHRSRCGGDSSPDQSGLFLVSCADVIGAHERVPGHRHLRRAARAVRRRSAADPARRPSRAPSRRPRPVGGLAGPRLESRVGAAHAADHRRVDRHQRGDRRPGHGQGGRIRRLRAVLRKRVPHADGARVGRAPRRASCARRLRQLSRRSGRVGVRGGEARRGAPARRGGPGHYASRSQPVRDLDEKAGHCEHATMPGLIGDRLRTVPVFNATRATPIRAKC